MYCTVFVWSFFLLDSLFFLLTFYSKFLFILIVTVCKVLFYFSKFFPGEYLAKFLSSLFYPITGLTFWINPGLGGILPTVELCSAAIPALLWQYLPKSGTHGCLKYSNGNGISIRAGFVAQRGWRLAGMVSQSVMSATDTLGHRMNDNLACLPEILVRDSGFAFALCPKMLACRDNWCW